jgi:SAM-dependent methyltransferase
MTRSADMPQSRPHATAEEVEAARHDTKLAQVLYHDWEAESYDDKWSISYDQRCIDYARGRFDAIVPSEEQRRLPYDRALELGCGTGFFLLNLIQAGVARRGSVTDLSPGMVKVAVRNAVEYRRVQTDFASRCDASLAEYERTGMSIPAAQVIAKLESKLAKRRKQLGR